MVLLLLAAMGCAGELVLDFDDGVVLLERDWSAMSEVDAHAIFTKAWWNMLETTHVNGEEKMSDLFIDRADFLDVVKDLPCVLSNGRVQAPLFGARGLLARMASPQAFRGEAGDEVQVNEARAWYILEVLVHSRCNALKTVEAPK